MGAGPLYGRPSEVIPVTVTSYCSGRTGLIAQGVVLLPFCPLERRSQCTALPLKCSSHWDACASAAHRCSGLQAGQQCIWSSGHNRHGLPALNGPSREAPQLEGAWGRRGCRLNSLGPQSPDADQLGRSARSGGRRAADRRGQCMAEEGVCDQLPHWGLHAPELQR